jgi:hypothetical protein
MAVNTAQVKGRRVLHFQTLEEMLADAEKTATGPVRTLGNWSPGQIFDHLALWLEFTLDGFPVKIPWYIRWAVWPFKGLMVRNPMSAGFIWGEREAKVVTPQREIALEEGLVHLKLAVSRWRAEPQRYPSPLLGKLTPAQWEQFQLRHCEHHLSFIVPG